MSFEKFSLYKNEKFNMLLFFLHLIAFYQLFLIKVKKYFYFNLNPIFAHASLKK